MRKERISKMQNWLSLNRWLKLSKCLLLRFNISRTKQMKKWRKSWWRNVSPKFKRSVWERKTTLTILPQVTVRRINSSHQKKGMRKGSWRPARGRLKDSPTEKFLRKRRLRSTIVGKKCSIKSSTPSVKSSVIQNLVKVSLAGKRIKTKFRVFTASLTNKFLRSRATTHHLDLDQDHLLDSHLLLDPGLLGINLQCFSISSN